MLSKRNFAMMMIMNLVVLVLFLFSVVLKEYFNDYDVNHAAETEIIEKVKADSYSPDAVSTGQQVLYIGTTDNGYYPAMKEWAGYRKKSFQVFPSLEAAEGSMQTKPYLLIDGELLENNTEDEIGRASCRERV